MMMMKGKIVKPSVNPLLIRRATKFIAKKVFKRKTINKRWEYFLGRRLWLIFSKDFLENEIISIIKSFGEICMKNLKSGQRKSFFDHQKMMLAGFWFCKTMDGILSQEPSGHLKKSDHRIYQSELRIFTFRPLLRISYKRGSNWGLL